MWKDPIVEEIRNIRLKIESDCNNDFDKIFAQAIEFQKKFVNRLVSKKIIESESILATPQIA
jgi:hypothetical protein